MIQLFLCCPILIFINFFIFYFICEEQNKEQHFHTQKKTMDSVLKDKEADFLYMSVSRRFPPRPIRLL